MKIDPAPVYNTTTYRFVYRLVNPIFANIFQFLFTITNMASGCYLRRIRLHGREINPRLAENSSIFDSVGSEVLRRLVYIRHRRLLKSVSFPLFITYLIISTNPQRICLAVLSA